MPSLEKIDALVKEWLSEYKSLRDEEVHSYASTVRHNDDLTEALYTTLHKENRQEIIDPVCHQLFEFYRSTEIELKRFALEFVPTLISTYLQNLSISRNKSCSGIEALILGIYNLEVVNEDGTPKVKTFTIPSLSRPSVYHEPISQTPLALIESTLSQHNQDQHQLVTWGPFPNVDRFTANNRQNVITYVLYCYNNSVSELSLVSQKSLCDNMVTLCQSGFETLYGLKESVTSIKGRTTLSSAFLLEALSGIYYIMYNSYPAFGTQVVETVSQRANYELYYDVMMVTNAIQSSLAISSEEDKDGEGFGLLSTSVAKPTFAKAALTNASFKAKKLPEDIPVVSDDDDVTSQNAIPTSSEEPNPDKERRMSETEKVLMSEKMRNAIKSALKKTDRMKRESKVKITLQQTTNTNTNGNDSDSDRFERMERRMSAGHVQTSKTDSVELKSYTQDHKWSSLDEDGSVGDSHDVTFSNNQRRSNTTVPTINTEV